MDKNNKMFHCFNAAAMRLYALLLMVLFATIYPNLSYSGYVKVGDLYYTTDDDSKTAKVTYETFQNYSNYSGLTSVHIPSSITVNGNVYNVKSISEYAFYRAKDLAYVSIDVGISQIGTFAFNECSSLISIIFPENLESIGDYAFFRCSSLKDVVLPKGLYSIGQRAFQECSKLNSIEFPTSIRKIGHAIFLNSSVKNIYLQDLAAWCAVITETSVFINADNVYLKGERIDRLDIPNGVTRVNRNAFEGLKCINTISLPSTLESIGEYAFYGCEFSNLYINDIKSWCKVIIETGNFKGFDRLYVGDELLKTLVVPDGITRVYDNVFKGIKSIQEVQFPQSLVSLGNNAFSQCEGIKSVCLPGNTGSVGENCFAGCSSLEEIIVESGEKSLSIKITSFKGCPVKKVCLYRNVSEDAFQNLASINHVEIGDKVDDCRSFKWKAYSDLQTIVSKAETPPLSQVFLDEQYKNVTVSIPETSKSAYESDPIWGPFWGVFPTGISLDKSQVSISPGETVILKVNLTPDNVTQMSLTWESSDENVVQVDEAGKITGIKDGEAKITVSTINGLKAVCVVSVKSLPGSIVLNVSESLELNIGEPFQLVATVLPEGCRDNEVYWQSEDEEVVSVEDGRLFTHRHGTACVSASTANGVSVQCMVEVSDEKFGVEIVPDTVNLYYAHNRVVDIVVRAKHMSKQDIQLNIEPTNIAYFVNDSTLFGKDLGTAMLTASYADDVYSSNIVKVLPFKLSIDSEPNYISPNRDFYLDKIEVSIIPEDMESKLDIHWTALTSPGESMFSSNSIFCWRPTKVKYKAYAVYGDYVFYSNEGILICTNVTISTPDSLVTSCGKLETLQANVSLYDRYGTPHSSTTWVSSDSSVVEVIQSGLNSCEFISHKSGIATITATVNTGANSSTVIIVEEAVPVETISLNPDKWEGLPGEEFEIKPTVYPENASNKSLVWTSSNNWVVNVDSNGLVKTLHTGEAYIYATAADGSGMSAVCYVTVLPVLVESIVLSPDSWNGEEGMAFQIEASVLPDNATNKKLRWTSSDKAVAIVDEDGFVAVLKEGTCVITATATDGSGIYAECIITSSAGIDEIFIDGEMSWNVYDINGALLKKNCDKDGLKLLSSGIYILQSGNNIIKIIIR